MYFLSSVNQYEYATRRVSSVVAYWTPYARGHGIETWSSQIIHFPAAPMLLFHITQKFLFQILVLYENRQPFITV
jgi:hypothetical protein